MRNGDCKSFVKTWDLLRYKMLIEKECLESRDGTSKRKNRKMPFPNF
jgi:hypothetical protein